MLQGVVYVNADGYMRIWRISVLIISFLIPCVFPFLYRDTVHAESTRSHTWQAAASCADPSQLNSKSLLVVLLDRSGSLVAGLTTDPEGYSGSVTNALADLWPGNIAVIPFGNGKADTLGNHVFVHSNTADLTKLKNLVDGTFPPLNDADTPLGLAMDHAQALFEKQGVTACSKVVVITDGQPTGPGARVDDIHNTFIPWFASQDISVNAVALKLDMTTDDGVNADKLLREITTATNGKYIPVVNAKDLASGVIGLYSAWKGLSFNQIAENQQNGNYPITVDARVTQTTIVTFHSTDVTVGQLQRSDGSTIPTDKLFTTTDRHYQMDNLVSPIVPGTYTITVGNDPDASVYALVDSPLKAEFITDTSTAAYQGQTFTIKAHFIDEHGGVVIKGATKVTVIVTEVINGQPVKVTIDLHQLAPDSDIFVGNYSVSPPTTKLTDQPQRIGNLTLDLTATYGDITRSATTTVPLYVPQAPPPPPCSKGFVQCNQGTLLGIGIPGFVVLLLVIFALLWFLRWHRSPEPRGYLVSARNERQTIELGTHRPLLKRLFSKSVITTHELALHPTGTSVVALLVDEPLAFVFTDDAVFLRLTTKNTSLVSVITESGENKLSETQREIKLGNRSEIRKGSTAVVIFQMAMPRAQTASHF